jgi:ribosome-binding factor A
LQETGTDAYAYLTFYPFLGFDAITDAQLTDLLNRVERILTARNGTGIFIRYAPEVSFILKILFFTIRIHPLTNFSFQLV